MSGYPDAPLLGGQNPALGARLYPITSLFFHGNGKSLIPILHHYLTRALCEAVPMAGMSEGLYLTLHLKDDEIRLLKFVSITSEDVGISPELRVANIKKEPQYLALSYTWGAATYEEEKGYMSSTPIRCNRETVKVSRNFHAFLSWRMAILSFLAAACGSMPSA